jgi:hypothetical protein
MKEEKPMSRHPHVARLLLPALALFVLFGPFARAQTAGGGAPIASADGEAPGTRIEVLELKRVSGGTVMLRFSLVNDSDQAINFGNDLTQEGMNESGTVGGIYLVDPVNKKKYLVVRDSQNKCDCSQKFYKLDAKSRANLWARFPAPPEDVKKIGVSLNRFAPLDDVPISG